MACTTSYSRVCSLPSPPRLLSPMLKKIFKRRTTKTYYPKLITNRDFIWCELVCSYKHGVALMTHLYWLLAQMFVGSHFRSSLCFRSWVDVNCGSIKASLIILTVEFYGERAHKKRRKSLGSEDIPLQLTCVASYLQRMWWVITLPQKKKNQKEVLSKSIKEENF